MNEQGWAVANLGIEAQILRKEHDEYMQAKQHKALAENALLDAIIEAVKPALPSICSKQADGRRLLQLGGGLWLDERGRFYLSTGASSAAVFTLDTGPPIDVGTVLDRTSLPAIVAVFVAAIRAQTGRLSGKTNEINKEASILEGIAQAFKIGGVR